jgi:hypothetical protein
MYGNFTADAPLRQTHPGQLFGTTGEHENKILRTCLSAVADEARQAAANVMEKKGWDDPTELIASLSEGDVEFSVLLQQFDGKRTVVMGAEWNLEPDQSERPILFSIHVKPQTDRPIHEWAVEIEISTNTDSYTVDPTICCMKEDPDVGAALHDGWEAEFAKPLKPLSSDGVRIVLGAAVEVLQYAPRIVAIIEGRRH